MAPNAYELALGPLFSVKILIIKMIPMLTKTENSAVYKLPACPLTWLSLRTMLCGRHCHSIFHVFQGHTAGEWRPRDWGVVSGL